MGLIPYKFSITCCIINDAVYNNDDLVKSRNSIEFVIPAKAGIQLFQDVLDPGFRRGDALETFYECINNDIIENA
jgi:hypothetical protein